MLLCGKVLDEQGGGSLKNLLAGLQWIKEIHKKYPVNILNISIEMDSRGDFDEEEGELLRYTLEELWNDGVMIVAAAGNRGPKPMSISPIGESGSCVCVGCHDGDFVGAGGRTCAEYSGRGPGKNHNPLKKPDIVAPGTDLISCSYKIPPFYATKSGTSMATPLVSGACALFMQKYPRATNIQMKRALLHSARDLGETWDIQGAGMLSVKRFLKNENFY